MKKQTRKELETTKRMLKDEYLQHFAPGKYVYVKELPALITNDCKWGIYDHSLYQFSDEQATRIKNKLQRLKKAQETNAMLKSEIATAAAI